MKFKKTRVGGKVLSKKVKTVFDPEGRGRRVMRILRCVAQGIIL